MAHVTVSTAQADTELRGAIRAAITAGNRVLIVGGPPGTFPYWMMQHPALMFWPASEKKASDDRRIVPIEVGAVLITNLLSHALEANVRHQARERRLICPSGTLSPGGVNRILEGIVEKTTKNGDGPMGKPQAPAAGPTHVVTPELDEQTTLLVDQIDEAITSLQLVRERVIENGRQLAGIRDQLDALATLKKMLK